MMEQDGHVSGDLIGTHENDHVIGDGGALGSSTLSATTAMNSAAVVTGNRTRATLENTPPTNDSPPEDLSAHHKRIPSGTAATQMAGLDGRSAPTASRQPAVNSTSGSQGVHNSPLINRRLFASPDGSTPLSSGPSGSGNSGGFTYEDLQRMIDEGVRRQIQEKERSKSVCSFLDADKGPLAPEIYLAPESNFKIPQLDSFKGASDSRDPESFIYGFRERMRLVRASDEDMCRTFCTCLVGEAWEWYIRLPQGSIKTFSDFATVFLKRYSRIKGPRISCESLLSIKQEGRETLKDFVKRFTDAAKRVDSLNDDLAVIAIRQGLKKGGPGTPRHDAHQHKFQTLQEFLVFLENYVRAEEDCGPSETVFDRLRDSAFNRLGDNRKRNPPRSSPPRNDSKRPKQGDNRPKRDPDGSNDEYRSHYRSYCIFESPQEELLNIADRDFELPPPLSLSKFTVNSDRDWCEYHQGRGHTTANCLQLRDVLEKLARQGDLIRYISPTFYRRHRKRYNGTGKAFKTPILRRVQVTRDEGHGRLASRGARRDYNDRRSRSRESRRDRRSTSRGPRDDRRTPSRGPRYDRSAQNSPRSERSHEIDVIMGGVQDVAEVSTRRERRGEKRPRTPVLNVDDHRPRSREPISFSEKDEEGVRHPHNDALVLALKMGPHRVKRVLVDAGSSADILFFTAFINMGYGVHDIKQYKTPTPLTGFTGNTVYPMGYVTVPVLFGQAPKVIATSIEFLVIDIPSVYNAIIGRRTLHRIRGVPSSYHLKLKFPTEHGIGEERGFQNISRECNKMPQASPKNVNLVQKAPRMVANPWVPPFPEEIPNRVETIDEIHDFQLSEGRVVKVGMVAMGDQVERLQDLLKRNADIFAFSTDEMPGIPRNIAEHRLYVDPTVRPIKQKRRPLGAERNKVVKDEVAKLLGAGFIREVQCPQWLANPVLVKKANGDWRMCIDFTSLNTACPMDPFPMPKIDQLVDSTAGFGFLTFMDAFSGYNQIKMYPEDEEKTAFTTDVGLYCYQVMPFGLKNAGATFQKMVNKIFASQIGRSIEVYMDDMLVKSSTAEQHLADLQEAFDVMRATQLKLNPKKSFFGLTGGKFLGYLVSCRGIEIHPTQSQAILQMTPPSNIKELQKLTGKLVALNRFIAKSGEICLPFFKIMKKGVQFQWTGECQAAFDKIKEYLSNPPLLAKPQPGEILLLYLSATDRVVSAALVKEEAKQQKPVYFVSHVLRDAETRYPPLEKVALALVVAARKLRPYFQAHPIAVYTKAPIKKAFTNLNSSGRLATWAVELSEFDISYNSPTALKSQILADFVAEYSGPLPEEENKTWQLFVDGASSVQGAGVGVQMLGPQGEDLKYAAHLLFPITNNAAEYEAIILGLKLAKGAGAEEVHVFSDSQLAVTQINNEARVLDPKLQEYREELQKLQADFRKMTIQHIPRGQNSQADALSKLATAGTLKEDDSIKVLDIPHPSIHKSEQVLALTEEQMDPWYLEMWKFLTREELPTDAISARRIKRMSAKYSLIDGDLYKRGYTLPWLRCLNSDTAAQMLAEAHEGVCGTHQGAKTLSRRVLRAGFFWPTMHADASNLVRKCDKCQRASNLSSVPPYERINIASAWPFDLWGIDILGPFP